MKVLKFLSCTIFMPNFFNKFRVISIYGFEKISPVILIVVAVFASGETMRSAEMNWLEILPGIFIFPPRFSNAFVNGFIGRESSLLLPVIFILLLVANFSAVKNLNAVPQSLTSISFFEKFFSAFCITIVSSQSLKFFNDEFLPVWSFAK